MLAVQVKQFFFFQEFLSSPDARCSSLLPLPALATQTINFSCYTHTQASMHGNVIGLVSMYIREYGSTLYVGLARAISPTNTNFRLTFLLTRLQEALYEDLTV